MKPLQEYIELDQKYRIAVAALKAIRERVYNSDVWIDKPLSDCGIAATNALKMMGEFDDDNNQ